MNVSCPQCSTVYRVDPAKVPAEGVRARCSACGGVIPVGMAGERSVAAAPLFAGVAPVSPPSPPLSPPHISPVRQSQPTPPRPAALPPLRPTPRTPWPSVPYASPPSVTPAPPATAPNAPPAPGERRPINPFLARDPSLRAKRLARALVSDMVAYYPAKHSEGLQRGTLKELFREEIKKSYDEYVMQVGSEFAHTTTHFQEALNEVLGAGKRIF